MRRKTKVLTIAKTFFGEVVRRTAFVHALSELYDTVAFCKEKI